MSVNFQKIGVASLKGDGTKRFFDEGFESASRIGVGVYELVLAGSIPPGEATPLATPWTNVGSAVVPVILNVTIDAAGGILTVVTFDEDGAPVDSGFCLVLYRTITTL